MEAPPTPTLGSSLRAAARSRVSFLRYSQSFFMWSHKLFHYFQIKLGLSAIVPLCKAKTLWFIFSAWYLQAGMWESQRESKYCHENVSLPKICKVIFGIDILDRPKICMTRYLGYFNSDVTPSPFELAFRVYLIHLMSNERSSKEVYMWPFSSHPNCWRGWGSQTKLLLPSYRHQSAKVGPLKLNLLRPL